MVSKELIGKKIGQGIDHQIHSIKVTEFCQAIGEKNPIYFDEKIARENGYEGIPIPPTFQTSFLFWGYPLLYTDMRAIGIDVDRMLHLKEEYEYIHPLYRGDTAKSSVTIADVKTGKLEMVTFACEYHNQKDQLCLTSRFVIVIRPPD